MFVFYDTETTGLDKNFSQILQIALVFTDDDFNVLSSKKLECRRSPWVVPSPSAMLTTGFVPDDLKFNKYSHYEMMKEVNEWVRGQHWPLTFMGYNTLIYDEPLLAQNFYQNLLEPGLTSAKNSANEQSNGRSDVMVLVKTTALYMPGVLTLDTLNSIGRPSLTLQNVAQQNGVVLSDEDAHDAMNDVKATIGVAKVIRNAVPEIWDQMTKMSTVEGVDAFLKVHPVFTYAANGLGKLEASVMTSLVEREGSTTQVMFKLDTDPAPYLNMTAEQLKDVLLMKEKDRPFILVRKHSQPVLMPLELSASVLPENHDETLYAARAQELQVNKLFLANLSQAALLAKEAKFVETLSLLPELMIDKETASPVKEKIVQWAGEFHKAPEWKEAVQLAVDFPERFKDELQADASLSRFAQLAERIIFEHAPAELTPERQEALKKQIAARVLDTDSDASYMTVAKARQELDKIEEDRAQGKGKWGHATDSQIRSLKLYYTAIEKEYTPFAPLNPEGSSPPEKKTVSPKNTPNNPS